MPTTCLNFTIPDFSLVWGASGVFLKVGKVERYFAA
jgi:hypothetical protein